MNIRRHSAGQKCCIPGRVPLLAMKLAMSMCWLSILRFFIQPTNCRLWTGKSSGSFGTPPSSSGPVRSKDLTTQKPWLHILSCPEISIINTNGRGKHTKSQKRKKHKHPNKRQKAKLSYHPGDMQLCFKTSLLFLSLNYWSQYRK